MRQAGYKPKNHDSGVYWIRASGGNGNKEIKHIQSTEEKFAYRFTLCLLFGTSFIFLLALLIGSI